MFKYSFLLLSVFLLVACEGSNNDFSENVSVSKSSEQPFIISDSGDTIFTGRPIPVRGKKINIDSLLPPVITPLGQPEIRSRETNILALTSPSLVQVSDSLPVNTPGKGEFLLPKVMQAKGRRASMKQPPPVETTAAGIKDNAIVDIRYINNLNGLNSDDIHCLLEDSDGNIWAGSGGSGLIRYDGHHLLSYSESEGLLYSSIHAILEDSDGHLWVGTDGKGLSRYDGQSLIHYTVQEGLSSNTIKTLYEDSQGSLWIGTNKGVNEYRPAQNGEVGTFTHYTTEQGLSHNSVKAILEDSKGDFWFGTEGGGLSKLVRNTQTGIEEYFIHYTVEQGLSTNYVYVIHEDKQGHIWLGTSNGLNKYIPLESNHEGSFVYYGENQGLSSNEIYSILEDSEGSLWLGTNADGVYKCAYNEEGAFVRYAHYTADEGLGRGTVYDIEEDQNNNIWFGILGDGGLYRLTKNSFKYIGCPGCFEDKKGDIWVPFSDGIGVLEDADIEAPYMKFYPVKGGPLENANSYTIQDKSGNIWAGVDGRVGRAGLKKYDHEKVTYYTRQQGLADNDISALEEDQDGNIWIGTHTAGVSRLELNAGLNKTVVRITNFNEAEGLVHRHVHALLSDSKGNIWIGTGRAGLSKFVPNKNAVSDNEAMDGTFTHYTKQQGLSSDQINTIIEDSRGFLWFGTWNGGLSIYDPFKDGSENPFTVIDKDDGLSNNIITSISEDPYGRFWVTTEKGLNLLVPKEADGGITDHSKLDFNIIHFGKEEGLKSNPGESFVDRKHQLWLGNSVLNLDQFQLSTASQARLYNIEVEQIYVDYRRLEDTTYRNQLSFGNYLNQRFDSVAAFYNYPISLKLPHQINHLTFHFSAIDWTSPQKVTYQFMLQGLDEDWSPGTLENKADYRNLTAGTYTFKVRAAGQNKLWSEPFEYTFRVLPPWWLSWWAYLLYLMVICGLFLAIRQYEMKRIHAKNEALRLKELDEVKTRLYTNITHEFRTPLTVIMGMLDQVAANPREWLGQGLQMIRRNGRNLLNLVNQMLELSKLESHSLPINMIQGDIVNYLRYLMESFHSLADSKNIQLQFESELETLSMDYDSDKILKVVSNLLSNALKFTPEGGKVVLRVAEKVGSAQWVEISVRDNGIGIPPHLLPHVFDRFYQVDAGHTRQWEGTGIGLALTNELVKLLGGEIKAESKLGQGTSFIVSLPITRKAPQDVKDSIKENLEMYIPSIPAFENARDLESSLMTGKEEAPLLLIIEDNADVIRYYGSMLSDHYRLQVAMNGQEGIDKAIELIPDIIISDVMMPRKDGFEVCNTLKLDERTSHIPIILLTAKADADSRLAGLARGADAYLAKPFEKRELLLRLEKLVELRRRLHERYASGQIPAPSSDQDLQMEDAFLQKVRQLLEGNLDDADFGIGELCQALLLSRSQLHRKLKALTGQSTSHVLRSMRLQKGKELLLSTDLTVSEVAYDTGFRDPNHFSRVFKEEFGLTPSKIREKP